MPASVGGASDVVIGAGVDDLHPAAPRTAKTEKRSLVARAFARRMAPPSVREPALIVRPLQDAGIARRARRDGDLRGLGVVHDAAAVLDRARALTDDFVLVVHG